MKRRVILVVATVAAFALTAAPASAAGKFCLVWVWIDGWRCAVGI